LSASLDKGIEIDLAALARDAARVLQHALNDAIGAPAVLGDLFEIAGQHQDDFVDIGALVFGQPGDHRCRGLLQLVEQFDREAGKIVDEVGRPRSSRRSALRIGRPSMPVDRAPPQAQ
jgi:hypothetical protein